MNVIYGRASLAAQIVQITLTIISNAVLYGKLPARLLVLMIRFKRFTFSGRLCIVSPSPDNAQLLALVFSLYHSAHNSCTRDDVSPSPRAVQKNLVEAARAYRQHII